MPAQISTKKPAVSSTAAKLRPADSSLPANIGQILMLALSDFQRRLDEDLAERGVLGISRRHRAVFLYLGQHGASRSVDLAEAAGIRPQSMMTIVHELEAEGLLKREPDPSDSRAKLIDFTTAGRKLIRELKRSTETVFDQYAEQIGVTELTAVFSGLEHMLAADSSE